MTINTILLHLSLIDDVGPAVIEKILAWQNNIDMLLALYHMSESEIAYQCKVSPALAKKIVLGLADTALLEKELSLIEQHGIQWLTRLDAGYPELLKAIHLPPTVLYFQGDLSTHAPGIAVVGSREANEYGRAVIQELVPPLVAHGFTIVSGGALGADSMAHLATMEAGGKTVAVLGTGLLRPSPKQNIPLYKAILDFNGAVVSPFHLRMEGFPGNFPARNRIISGLSKGCVVVQAGKQSGARITAEFALEQSREVFAVPGPIYDSLSEGCNALIQQGAKLVTCPGDVLAEFGYYVPQESETPAKKAVRAPEKQLPAFDDSGLSEIEKSCVIACKQPCSVDDLLDLTGLELAQVHGVLFELQLKKLIEQNAAGLYQRL